MNTSSRAFVWEQNGLLLFRKPASSLVRSGRVLVQEVWLTLLKMTDACVIAIHVFREYRDRGSLWPITIDQWLCSTMPVVSLSCWGSVGLVLQKSNKKPTASRQLPQHCNVFFNSWCRSAKDDTTWVWAEHSCFSALSWTGTLKQTSKTCLTSETDPIHVSDLLLWRLEAILCGVRVGDNFEPVNCNLKLRS